MNFRRVEKGVWEGLEGGKGKEKHYHLKNSQKNMFWKANTIHPAKHVFLFLHFYDTIE